MELRLLTVLGSLRRRAIRSPSHEVADGRRGNSLRCEQIADTELTLRWEYNSIRQIALGASGRNGGIFSGLNIGCNRGEADAAGGTLLLQRIGHCVTKALDSHVIHSLCMRCTSSAERIDFRFRCFGALNLAVDLIDLRRELIDTLDGFHVRALNAIS